MDADAIVIGAGLAGMTAACELADAGRRVILLDQEGPQSLGGQAFWSLGGFFLIDSPEQRRMGIRDSLDLAWRDWLGTADFAAQGSDDDWPRAWARAYVEFAAGEMRTWLRAQGIALFPVVGWAERGGAGAGGHGNSVPRFHIVWGTGPAVVAPFAARLHDHAAAGRVRFAFRHRVTDLEARAGRICGVAGDILAQDDAPRGQSSTREVVDAFRFEAPVVLVASGGIGSDLDLVRALACPPWPRAAPYADRRARLCRWSHDRGGQIRRRPRNQRRPDVALLRRRAEF